MDNGVLDISCPSFCPDKVSPIRAAIQSKNKMPLSCLTSWVILNESNFKIEVWNPSRFRPESSIREILKVEPPTSRARYVPRSSPVGSWWLYDGNIFCGLSNKLSPICDLSPLDSVTKFDVSLEFLNSLSTSFKNSEYLFPSPTSPCRSAFSPLMVEGEIQMLSMVWRTDLVLSKLLMMAAKKAWRTLYIAEMSGCISTNTGRYRGSCRFAARCGAANVMWC